jgi:hypothetical protein
MFWVPRITGPAAATIPHLKDFKGHWSYGKHLDASPAYCVFEWVEYFTIGL